jgi:hypothetical protein
VRFRLSEKEPIKIVVPTGFIKVTVEPPVGIRPDFLAFTPAFIFVRDPNGSMRISQSIPIGVTQVIPINAGLFSISTKLGDVMSQPQNIEVKAGEVTEIRISFGK